MLCFKKRNLVEVVVTFLIKTITPWPPLYVSKIWPYYIFFFCPWQGYLGQILLFVYNHKLLFTLTNFSSHYTNGNANNVNRDQILDKPLEFPNGIHVENMKTNLGWKVEINDTMIVNSIVMTTCMSLFSRPLLHFNSMPKFSTFTYMPFCKSCSCIFIWGEYD